MMEALASIQNPIVQSVIKFEKCCDIPRRN